MTHTTDWMSRLWRSLCCCKCVYNCSDCCDRCGSEERVRILADNGDRAKRRKPRASKQKKDDVQIYDPSKHILSSRVCEDIQYQLPLQFGKASNEKLSYQIKEDASKIDPDVPVLILCFNTTRLGSDVSRALEELPLKSPIAALIILHIALEFTLPKVTSDMRLEEEQKCQSLCGIYDLAYKEGLYPCDMNSKSLLKIANFVTTNKNRILVDISNRAVTNEPRASEQKKYDGAKRTFSLSQDNSKRDFTSTEPVTTDVNTDSHLADNSDGAPATSSQGAKRMFSLSQDNSKRDFTSTEEPVTKDVNTDSHLDDNSDGAPATSSQGSGGTVLPSEETATKTSSLTGSSTPAESYQPDFSDPLLNGCDPYNKGYRGMWTDLFVL